jgi:hypothetical protein
MAKSLKAKCFIVIMYAPMLSGFLILANAWNAGFEKPFKDLPRLDHDFTIVVNCIMLVNLGSHVRG